MLSQIMKPVKKSHTNDALRGWDADVERDAVNDLPITRIQGGCVSIWRVKSIWQRIRFLFHGEITFQSWGQTHPPILLYCGDVVIPPEKMKEEECITQ